MQAVLQSRNPLVDCPVDLANFRSITGADPVLEQRFFRLFFESSVECLDAMQTSMKDGACDVWRRQAHALKGTSLNLGAGQLSQLCLEAQENHQAQPEKKLLLLTAIRTELKRVEQYLNDMRDLATQ